MNDLNSTLTEEVTLRKRAEQEKAELVEKLTKVVDEVNTLSGLLPICSSCKMIRDKEGQWHKVEDYIQTRTDAEFTHGICPKCAKSLYPDRHDTMPDDNKLY